MDRALAPSARLVEAAECRHTAEYIRVRGMVQGVGFRPMVWRLARAHGLRGWVSNDGQGVIILACGPMAALDGFAADLPHQSPPLARIESIERAPHAKLPEIDDFRIVPSQGGQVFTHVTPDAASCPACVAEVFDPAERRYRYPFTNCTHCGPRLSITQAIPYDRAATTMRAFALCDACASEYADPANRRFHAQPVACPVCGPQVWLEQTDGSRINAEQLNAQNAVEAACTLVQRGHVVAIKGLGGFQLAGDGADEAAVSRLRNSKHRASKPLALMARDVDMVRRYCHVSDAELVLLQSAASPIVILATRTTGQLAPSVAPGLTSLGFMLPNTPLHHLLMQPMQRPMVLTSGNLSDEPQCIDNADARSRLGGLVDFFLMHNRDIARRVDDSVMQVVAGLPRVIRRARGYAPAPIRLAAGFEQPPTVLAMGADQHNSFCLLREGQAIVSHHMGNLANAHCRSDYLQSITSYLQLFNHRMEVVAVDHQLESQAHALGHALAQQHGAVLQEVAHHHAHIAACMAENELPLATKPITGVVLESLLSGVANSTSDVHVYRADYRQCERLGSFTLPVAPPAVGKSRHNPRVHHTVAQEQAGDVFMGEQLVGQLTRLLALHASDDDAVKTVALSGCAFHTPLLLKAVVTHLEVCGFKVLTHRQVPANDGGLALGQAVVVAARTLANSQNSQSSNGGAHVFGYPGSNR